MYPKLLAFVGFLVCPRGRTLKFGIVKDLSGYYRARRRLETYYEEDGRKVRVSSLRLFLTAAGLILVITLPAAVAVAVKIYNNMM